MTQVAFPDVKPFPASHAAMGHNKPPLEESIIMEFDAALREHDGLLDRIEQMRIKAETAKPCTDDDTAGRMGDFIKMTSVAAKTIEAERELLNRPLLTAQRTLKGMADQYASIATNAGNNVRSLLNEYLAKKEQERRAEVARIAEIERKAEAERQRVIAERQAEADRVAEIERKRLQDIADEQARIERARLQVIEDERAAEEARDAVVVEVVAEVVSVASEPVFVAPIEPVFNPLGVGKEALRGDYGTVVSTVETWDVKVTNIRQVPDAFLKHPSVIEALEKVIRPSVRGKTGLRDIKGCEITSSLSSSIR